MRFEDKDREIKRLLASRISGPRKNTQAWEPLLRSSLGAHAKGSSPLRLIDSILSLSAENGKPRLEPPQRSPGGCARHPWWSRKLATLTMPTTWIALRTAILDMISPKRVTYSCFHATSIPKFIGRLPLCWSRLTSWRLDRRAWYL